MRQTTPAVLIASPPADRDGIVNTLERATDDVRLLTAGSIQQAKARLGDSDIDCVVSVYEIPDENGRDFLGGLRFLRYVREENETLPFVLFTDIVTEDIAKEAIDEDVTAYIKRWEDEGAYRRLSTVVQTAIARRRAERQADELARVNEVLRNVNQSLARAGSRSEIEGQITAELTDAETYGFTAFGAIDPERDEHRISYWQTSTGGRAQTHPLLSDDSDIVTKTLETSTVQVQTLPVDETNPDNQKDSIARAIERDFNAIAAIPIVYQDHLYGVLVVHATRADAFDEQERAILRELGETIAHALNAIDARQSLEQRERELSRQNERLENFANIVTHDLRNPLSVAKGFIESTEMDVETRLENVGESLDRMEEIVEDVLTLARFQQSSLDLDTVSLEDVVTDAWRTVETNGVTLEYEGLGSVEADASRLQQLFENLFRNAVEHAFSETEPAEDPIVEVAQHSNRITVSDNGAGIPEKHRESAFDTGFTTSDTGTGFGLAIVKEIAELHGWEPSVETGDSGGTVFTFDGVESGRS